MKALAVRIIMIVSTIFSCNILHAQNWVDYLDKEVDINLIKYGRVQDGVEQAGYAPCEAYGNDGEFIALDTIDGSPVLVWGRTASGAHCYSTRISGNTLYLTGYCHALYPYLGEGWLPYNGWIKILSVKGDTIRTIDNLNVYRYFKVEPY